MKKVKSTIDSALKPIIPKKCSECEKLINEVAEKEKKNRLACFSILSCLITPLFDLRWQIFFSTTSDISKFCNLLKLK